MANRARYQVVEIVDDELPVWIGLQRVGESYLDLCWQYRHAIDNRFCNWLATLKDKPQYRIVLGNTAPLTWATARALMQYQRQRVANMSGSESVPDFALWLPTNRGGREHRRECVRVKGGTIEAYRSIEHAARALRTSRDDVEERLDGGCRDGQGWAWFDGEAQTH